ncbi:MAG TPA: hypothetical protein VF050_02140, partial [Moraxellaceae bacterium]
MLFKTKPLALAVAKALGGASLLLSISTLALADENAAAVPAANTATNPAAGVPAAGAPAEESATPATSAEAATAEATAPVAPAAAEKARQLDTVVVTAQRRKENLQKVPAAITAISGN